jgi:hypothetical protein
MARSFDGRGCVMSAMENSSQNPTAWSHAVGVISPAGRSKGDPIPCIQHDSQLILLSQKAAADPN